jgi:DNA-damage-inducible protein J
MPTTTMVYLRVDEQTKAEATETSAAMGLAVSDAVRRQLCQIYRE